MNATHANACLQRMCTHRKRRIVCQLPTVVIGVRLADLRSTTKEGFLHVDRGDGVVGVLRVGLMFKLESRLVDDRLIDDRCFSKLNALLTVLRVELARRQ